MNFKRSLSFDAGHTSQFPKQSTSPGNPHLVNRESAERPGIDSRQCKIFSLLYSVETVSVAQPGSYPKGTRGNFPESKAAGT
jgi:hypothetical protein